MHRRPDSPVISLLKFSFDVFSPFPDTSMFERRTAAAPSMTIRIILLIACGWIISLSRLFPRTSYSIGRKMMMMMIVALRVRVSHLKRKW